MADRLLWLRINPLSGHCTVPWEDSQLFRLQWTFSFSPYLVSGTRLMLRTHIRYGLANHLVFATSYCNLSNQWKKKVPSTKFTLCNAEQGFPWYKVQNSIKFIVLRDPVDLYGWTFTATTGMDLHLGLASCLASRWFYLSNGRVVSLYLATFCESPIFAETPGTRRWISLWGSPPLDSSFTPATDDSWSLFHFLRYGMYPSRITKSSHQMARFSFLGPK